jgi:hypothetical protein
MNDKQPPAAFNWNLGPKDPDDAEPQQPVAPPQQYLPPAAPYQPPAAPYQPPPQQYQPPARPPYEDVPTQAIAWEPEPTRAYAFDPAPSFDSAMPGPTEPLGAQAVGLHEIPGENVRHDAQRGSAIDSLFGESQFQEYEAGPFPSEGLSALVSTRPREQREPMGKTQKILLLVAGGLVALLALLGVFMLGTRLDGLIPEAAPPAEEIVPTTAPVAAPPAVGPLAAGTHAWDALLGTECLDPYGSAWEEEYTVVDCAAPHAAQMVFRGIFADEAFAPYPDASVLQARINLLCTSPTTINYAVASQFADIQIAASYAATEADWDAGQRDYYCFVSRSSGEPLTVANAPVASDALVATVPGNDP